MEQGEAIDHRLRVAELALARGDCDAALQRYHSMAAEQPEMVSHDGMETLLGGPEHSLSSRIAEYGFSNCEDVERLTWLSEQVEHTSMTTHSELVRGRLATVFYSRQGYIEYRRDSADPIGASGFVALRGLAVHGAIDEALGWIETAWRPRIQRLVSWRLKPDFPDPSSPTSHGAS